MGMSIISSCGGSTGGGSTGGIFFGFRLARPWFGMGVFCAPHLGLLADQLLAPIVRNRIKEDFNITILTNVANWVDHVKRKKHRDLGIMQMSLRAKGFICRTETVQIGPVL